MATYKITNVSYQKCLNVHGDNVTYESMYENQNVTLWADSSTNEQKWVIDSLSTGQFIRSAVNTNFGLNIWTGDNNCDVHTIAGNEHDAMVDISSGSAGMRYTIKLTNYNLYLTAGGSGNEPNVYWAAPTGGNDQYWTFLEIEDVPVTPPESDIEAWYWSNTARNAMNNKGPVSAVTRQEWNSLCDKVKECLDRAGESWYTYYGPNGGYTPNYTNAKMSSTDKTLTAARFNAVRGNIGSHVSTGISPVSPGDKVMGWYFLTIETALNDWISILNN